jgi:methylated-DNA-[protein]-cysteine S-methyltransferase
MIFTAHYSSPMGGIILASDGEALTGLWFDGQKNCGDISSAVKCDMPIFDTTAKWLDIYFGGKIPHFTPPLSLHTTPFRRSVYDILLTIPYGEVITYGQLASMLSRDMSAQAVGGAVGHNPISLIIPCHRVIGADGKLTGYAAGIERKAALLEMERRISGI